MSDQNKIQNPSVKNGLYSKIRKPLGIVLIIIGLILHLIPLFPAGCIIILGLELVGIRILLQDKFKIFLSTKKKS